MKKQLEDVLKEELYNYIKNEITSFPRVKNEAIQHFSCKRDYYEHLIEENFERKENELRYYEALHYFYLYSKILEWMK